VIVHGFRDYAQWKSREAYEKMKNPRAIIYLNDVLSIAKIDGDLYKVVFEGTSSPREKIDINAGYHHPLS
jgi:hypothetical protein